MFDATGTVRFGDWNFSLRERLQMTHRTDDFNEYQNPRDAIMLKSRIMVKYKGLGMFEPYAFFELRHYLNAPVINATYDGTFYRTPDGYKKAMQDGSSTVSTTVTPTATVARWAWKCR